MRLPRPLSASTRLKTVSGADGRPGSRSFGPGSWTRGPGIASCPRSVRASEMTSTWASVSSSSMLASVGNFAVQHNYSHQQDSFCRSRKNAGGPFLCRAWRWHPSGPRSAIPPFPAAAAVCQNSTKRRNSDGVHPFHTLFADFFKTGKSNPFFSAETLAGRGHNSADEVLVGYAGQPADNGKIGVDRVQPRQRVDFQKMEGPVAVGTKIDPAAVAAAQTPARAARAISSAVAASAPSRRR